MASQKDNDDQVHENPNIAESSTGQINTDKREPYDWKSRWCGDSSKKITNEAILIGIFFVLSIISIVLIWRGSAFSIMSWGCDDCSRENFDNSAYIFIGGLLGGTIYGLKYLYKVVARGFWHLDRRLWRIFSPWLSAGVALAFGALFDSGIVGLSFSAKTSTAYFSIGFLTGYFADSAIAKLGEVADTLFGSAESKKTKS